MQYIVIALLVLAPIGILAACEHTAPMEKIIDWIAQRVERK